MASTRITTLLAVLLLCTLGWMREVSAAPTNTTELSTFPPPPPITKAPWSLLGNKNGNQQKHLNPQLVAYFLRPLTNYLVSLSNSAGVSGLAAASPSYDDYGAASTYALPPVPTKLSLLASLFGWGAPVGGGVVNPSYGYRRSGSEEPRKA